MSKRLTHVGPDGAARIVDVSEKPSTGREAVARGRVRMSRAAARLAARQAALRQDVQERLEYYRRAQPAHGVPERALSEHGRMLGRRHSNLYDSGKHLHPQLQFLRSSHRAAN